MSTEKNSYNFTFPKSQILTWVLRWWVHATVYFVSFIIPWTQPLPFFFGTSLQKKHKRILEPQNALLPYKAPPHCLIGFYFNKSDDDYQVVRVHSFGDTNNACLDDSLTKFVLFELKSTLYVQGCGEKSNIIALPRLVKDCAEVVHKKLAVYKDTVAVIICSETETMAQRLDLWILLRHRHRQQVAYICFDLMDGTKTRLLKLNPNSNYKA
ncbi:hypothetical protein CR513_39695, partial [Mucuna pruriens]